MARVKVSTHLKRTRPGLPHRVGQAIQSMHVTRTITFLWICLAIALAPRLTSAQGREPKSHDYGGTFSDSGQVSCYQTPGYFVVEKSVQTGVGNDFLIKYKTNPEDTPLCTDSPETEDFEIKGEWAAYFADLINDRLYLVHYTGPGPYTFSIWDLIERQKVYESFGANVEFKQDSVIFWKETGMATTANCPDLPEWESHGLGGAMETRVILSVPDFKLTKTNETRCRARQ